MNLIWFEWKKLWKNASVLKIALCFIFISTLMFWGELERDKAWTAQYLEMHNTVDGWKQEELSTWLEAEWAEYENSKNEDLRYEKYMALRCIEEEINAMESYDSYRDAIQKRYEQSESISIFANADEHQKTYRKQIAQTYDNLRIKAPMQLQPYQGVKKLLDFFVGDLLVLVFLIYLVSVVFIQEKKTGKMEFAYTSLYGRGRLFAAKTAAVYGSSVLYMLFTFFINAILAVCVYGTISLKAAIQSIQEMCSVPYAWTIGQYFVAYLLLKGIAALALSAVAVVTAKVFSSEAVTTMSMATIVGLSIWAESMVMDNGFLSVFRYWNVWSVLRGNSIIGNYELIRIGNCIIEAVWGIPVIIVLSVFLMLLSSKGRHLEGKRRNRRFRERKKTPHSVFFYEMKKMWVHQGGIFLFVIFILVEGMVIGQYHNYLGTDEFYYQRYIDRFGEQITDETDELILQEETRLNKLEENLMQETDEIKSMMLQQELECKGGFQKYVDKVNALREDEKKEILLKDTQYRILFEGTDVSRMMVVLLCASFAFIIPPVFQKEKETGVEVLQNTAKNGGRRLWNAKITTILTYMILIILVFDSLIFFKGNTDYRLNLKAPAECLGIYWHIGVSWSVLTTFLAGFAMQCMIAVIVTILLSFGAKRVKNQYMMAGIILGGTVIPTLLLPYSPIRWIGWAHNLLFVFTARRFWLVLAMGGVALWMVRKERAV